MNRLELLRRLAPGFLPLIIFIAADALWGTLIGLLVAVACGVVELAVSFIREKKIDSFVLLDTLLIVALGLISVLLRDDIYFKLKPALIEAVFCVLLGISGFTRWNIMLLLTGRYLRGLEIDERRQRQFQRSIRAMFFLFLGHTLLIVYAAFFLSRGAWGFISGGLFYLVFVVYIAGEWLRQRYAARRMQRQYQDEEWFDLVDAEGRSIGAAPRSLCHAGPGRLHAVVHLHLLDKEDRIFLQKRAAHKQIQPDKWDTAVGGHVARGESIEAALKREAAEELGLERFQARLLGRYVWESAVESELVYMFVGNGDTAPRINPQEISEGRFWRARQIRQNLGKGVFTPNFEFEFDILRKQVFKERE